LGFKPPSSSSNSSSVGPFLVVRLSLTLVV
jgi:hypothetical protein